MPGYQIDLDTKHSVIRLTVKEETVTEEMAEDMYRHLLEVTAKGGPYAAIFDLTTAKHTTIKTDSVRSWGRHRRPAVPQGVCPFCGHPRKHVVVGTEPNIYGLARVFEMCADAIGSSVDVVRTLTEAYEIVEDRPDNFNECVLVEEVASRQKRRMISTTAPRCPECGSLWFHEPHKDDCSIGRQQKQQIEDAKRLMRGHE